MKPGRRVTIGPFVTRYAGPVEESDAVVLTARRHRKRLGSLPPHDLSVSVRIERDLSLLWQPARLGWWIGNGFAIGSAFFLSGSAFASFAAGWLPAGAPDIPWLFAIGAIFFTLAAWGQFLEALNASPSPQLYGEHPGADRWRWIGIRPRMIGWWASAIQLAGTLAFNAMTLDALVPGIAGLPADAVVWAPNVAGSVCFLAASQLALIEVSHRIFSWRVQDLNWWIAAVNMAGSVAFMLSALFAWFPPGSATAIGPWWDNVLTCLGAACFLAGALLMLPELAERKRGSNR